MLLTTKAIVLSSLKYGDSDLIVKCFTESSGLKSYLLRNILKSKRGKLKTSYFQPLTLLELEVFHKDKGTLEKIRDAKIETPYKSLQTKILKSSLAIFIAEILSNAIQEEVEDKPLFQYIKNSLLWLDKNTEISNFHILFLLKLSRHLGFYPDTSNIEYKYFNLTNGNFQTSNTGKYTLEGIAVQGLKSFFGIEFDALDKIKITKLQRQEVLHLLLQYYRLHLQGFKHPKSLLVLNQIFE